MLFEMKILDIYRNMLFTRNDNTSGVFYFSAEDFPGLQVHPYAFPASTGHTLQGYFYHYENPFPQSLLVFEHGMGNGHRAYMREIEILAKAGFLVFAYDHTGCMASGGEGCRGFAQSLADLDDCFRALKQEEALQGYDLSVIGHSWGGYSTMNITALHPQITHVVSMCGFISVEQILKQSFSGLLKGYIPAIFALEKKTNPKYADINALQTLANTQAKILLVYSADDSMIRKDLHYDVLHEFLSSRENIRFLLLANKDHNPTYTREAVVYKNRFFKELSKARKKKLLKTPAQQKEFMNRYDFRAMTDQDMDVWQEIIGALRDPV